MADVLAKWLDRAQVMIVGKFEDARAHAGKAITESLRQTTDGRPTASRASSSPSAKAALNRLDELADQLVSLIRTAREKFYDQSFADELGSIPEALRITANPEPTGRKRSSFVASLMHGETLERAIRRPIRQAKESLLPALVTAGRRQGTGKDATTILDGWRSRAEAAVSRTVRTALSDSEMAAISVVKRDILHPDFFDTTPLAVGE